jgi:hypothetical protein
LCDHCVTLWITLHEILGEDSKAADTIQKLVVEKMHNEPAVS